MGINGRDRTVSLPLSPQVILTVFPSLGKDLGSQGKPSLEENGNRSKILFVDTGSHSIYSLRDAIYSTTVIRKLLTREG